MTSSLTPAVLSALALYMVANAGTPGPNAVMLTASGVNLGVRKSVPLIVGFALGLGSLVVLVGLGLGNLLSVFPWMHQVLKVIGASYLIWLSVQIWRASEGSEAEMDAALGVWKGFLLQTVNPKAWMMAIGAFSVVATPGVAPWIQTATVLGAVGVIAVPIMVGWATLGARLRSALRRPATRKIFNRAMASLLLVSVILLFL